MKKFTPFVFAFFLLGLTTSKLSSQSCGSASSVISDIWDAVDDKAVVVGCSVGAVLPGIGYATCLASSMASFTSKMVTFWNGKVNNSWAMIGPRILEPKKKYKGTLVGTGGRIFITPYPFEKSSGTVTINELGGKGKTSVVVCKVDKNGNSTKLTTKWFNDTPDRKDKVDEKRSFSISGVKGYILTIHFDGKSVGNTFKYDVKLK
ncbi:MAG: hypothetical protein P1U56_15575 [Saprospiraceae bacterium]|nr:hypothetical protein [Saprospiraceae bacterium]